ncbi:MAG: peptidoglycan-binding protein [Luteimonas sp.]
MTAPVYEDLIQPKGAAYRASQLKGWSHYLEPIIDDPARLSGNSRIWGDATPEVQSRVIDSLVEASREAGLDARNTAHVLAIARIESGFNPDAAAGTTSASGLGQFVDKTGLSYGLNGNNRFDVDAQASALVAHFIDNRALAERRGQDEAYIYKYHHDGPALDYGGLALSRAKVLPLIESYTRFVEERFGFERANGISPELKEGVPRVGLESPAFGELLREGQRGHGVTDLQTTLAGLGFRDARDAPLQTDGRFGPRTGEAVRAFQQSYGLQADGIVGPETHEALDRARQSQDQALRNPGGVSKSPIESLLSAARSGDTATLQTALDDLTATRFGQMFQQARDLASQELERNAQVDIQSQCGPER